jgi:hypothetical protein
VKIRIKKAERERSAVAEHDCPLTMCNAKAGMPCYSPRIWVEGQGYRKSRPRAHPHEERIALVPEYRDVKSFEEMQASKTLIPRPGQGSK